VNLVRREAKRYKKSAPWKEIATKIEAALGLNTEPKACTPAKAHRIANTKNSHQLPS